MAFITAPVTLHRRHTFLASHRRALPTSRRRASLPHISTMTLDVLVTGAAGRTGRLVLASLLAKPDEYKATGLVRSIARAKEALKDEHAEVCEALVEGDVTKPETLEGPMRGKKALVILTSAMPRMKAAEEGKPPSFYFEEDGMPELVDWRGGKNQVDVAREAGVEHVVLVGSMGSSDENDPLNRVGNGNILRWKRKAEEYLIDSGVPYTIINPCGLKNGGGGIKLEVGRNDELFKVYGRGGVSMPREEVARVVVAALGEQAARNKAFDIVGLPQGEGEPTVDLAPLFAKAGSTL